MKNLTFLSCFQTLFLFVIESSKSISKQMDNSSQIFDKVLKWCNSSLPFLVLFYSEIMVNFEDYYFTWEMMRKSIPKITFDEIFEFISTSSHFLVYFVPSIFDTGCWKSYYATGG